MVSPARCENIRLRGLEKTTNAVPSLVSEVSSSNRWPTLKSLSVLHLHFLQFVVPFIIITQFSTNESHKLVKCL